jgi:hypothetical protein
MKKPPLILVMLIALGLNADSQVQWSGQVSAFGVKSDRSPAPRVLNGGDPTLGWRLDLFLDGRVTDDIVALANVRVSGNEYLYFDYVALRFADIAGLGINFQIGKFDMPFGNLDERRFPTENFLFGLPLIYEYRTSLPNTVITRADLLNNRGRGIGMRLIDLGVYDIGAMVFGDLGDLHYALAVSNGTISSASGGQNDNKDFSKIVRLAYTPMMGLTLAAAGAMGAYLPNDGTPIPRTKAPEDYLQKIGEVDLEFSRGHFLLNGEVVYSEWMVPLENQDARLSVMGYYGEAKYTWFPRFFTAARVSGLRFSQLDFSGVQRRWDYDVFEIEGGIGVHLDRNALVKVVRRHTKTLGTTDPHDDLTAIQFAVAF